MSHAFADIAFTDSVKAMQVRDGSRTAYERAFGNTASETAMTSARPVRSATLGHAERAYIEAQRSFFMATVSETGWPYVQHRGGAPGFVQVVDAGTIEFVDLAGNRQFVSVGNLTMNDRVALIFVDYANQARLKILGHLSMRDVEPGDARLQGWLPPELRPRAQRLMTIHVAATDWNCSKYIPLLLSPEAVMAEMRSQGLAGED